MIGACAIPWNGRPYFLIDSNLENGTSGSPVITTLKETWRLRNGEQVNTGLAMFLLGINSSTFPRRRKRKPVELNAVYLSSLIDEITLS